MLKKVHRPTGSLNCWFTCWIIGNISSSRDDIWSGSKSLMPKSDPICLINGLIWLFSFNSFPRPFSTTVGNDSRRRVCPVGAVSKTTTEKFIPRTNLRNKGMWASQPGTIDHRVVMSILHDFGVAHGFVYSRECAQELVHYGFANFHVIWKNHKMQSAISAV